MTMLHHYWQQSASALAIAHPPEAASKSTGYISVRRGHRKKRLHVWIWEQLVGPIPDGMQVDHINGIRTDCRLENLRLVSVEVNARNRGKPINNTSGITGVSEVTIKGVDYFAAYWQHPFTRKRTTKYFSIAKLGYEQAREKAIRVRAIALAELQANHQYTDRHGL